jgi:curved DNA-binding protein
MKWTCGMEYKDYYKILGVDKGADAKAIKKAYRKLAREYHPDVKPGDKVAEARFKEINEAYEVLGDPDKRSRYDQLGANWERFQQGGGRPGDFDWSQYAGGTGGAPGGVRYTTNVEDLRDLFGGDFQFSDFFSQLFGGGIPGGAPGAGGRGGRGGYTPRPRRGQDYEQEVPITLAEAYHGTARRLDKEGRQLEVKIPAGAATGTRVRFGGEGGAGTAGGSAGDLFLRVVVEPDARFERRGDDLVTTATVDLYTAVLGGEAPVETLSGGHLMLRIPPGTQPGSTIRLRGQGMPRLRQAEEKGDLLVKIAVRLPRDLTEEQRSLFEELKRMSQT